MTDPTELRRSEYFDHPHVVSLFCLAPTYVNHNPCTSRVDHLRLKRDVETCAQMNMSKRWVLSFGNKLIFLMENQKLPGRRGHLLKIKGHFFVQCKILGGGTCPSALSRFLRLCPSSRKSWKLQNCLCTQSSLGSLSIRPCFFIPPLHHDVHTITVH